LVHAHTHPHVHGAGDGDREHVHEAGDGDHDLAPHAGGAHGVVNPHAPRHASHRRESRRRLSIVLVVMAIYMVAEAIGGFLTGSLALLADSGHMLSDVAALLLSLFAIWAAERPARAGRTFGYHRLEILAALANGAILLAISILISVEAIQRFRTPEPVLGGWMLAIAIGGLLANAVGLWLLHAQRHHGLNARAAWLHIMSDALGSVGTIVSAALILAFGWQWADPIASLVIAVLVIHSSWALLKETVAVLMEHAPRHIDVDAVRQAMSALDGVHEVGDLHVWTITSGLESLSAHVCVDDASRQREFLRAARPMLADRFGIEHVTIQIEPHEKC
jgi:cobalt-zinc-cadmium efflux system protein